MNTSLFDEYGNLNIEDMIINQPSFMKIMEDGIVTDEELKEQSERVTSLLHTMEKSFSQEQIDQIRELLAEISVLTVLNNLSSKTRMMDSFSGAFPPCFKS